MAGKRLRLSPEELAEGRVPWRYPLRSNHVHAAQARQIDPVILGTAAAPVDDEELANLCILFHRMPRARQDEFWQIRGDSADKMAFLLRYGRFEIWRKQ